MTYAILSAAVAVHSILELESFINEVENSPKQRLEI